MRLPTDRTVGSDRVSAVTADANPVHENVGGWGGIRTPETVARLPVFKTGAFNHSATHPTAEARLQGRRQQQPKSARNATYFVPGCSRKAAASDWSTKCAHAVAVFPQLVRADSACNARFDDG